MNGTFNKTSSFNTDYEKKIGVWHHFVYTTSSVSGSKVYQNGSLIGAQQDSYESDLSLEGWTYTIGSSPQDYGCNFEGMIDDILIFDTPLSDLDVRDLFISQATEVKTPVEMKT
jgi:hypothetical protein